MEEDKTMKSAEKLEVDQVPKLATGRTSPQSSEFTNIPAEENQEKQKEKKGSGCSIPFLKLPGCGCKSCACSGCLGIILIMILFFLVIYFRPPFVWNSIKSYLNDDYSPTIYSEQSSSEVMEEINAAFKNGTTGSEGNVEVEVTEEELQSLVRDQLGSDDFLVDVEPNYFRIVSDIDNNDERPLWLIFEFALKSDGDIELSKFGFEKIDAPDFLEKKIFEGTDEAAEIVPGNNDGGAQDFIEILIDASDNGITLDSVCFDKDRITITGSK